MDYIEIKLVFKEVDPWKDIFTSLLGDLGCDSFMDGENDHILLAYITENLFHEKNIFALLDSFLPENQPKISFQKIITQDWNAVWEANYSPVLIADQCYIRAPFHESNPHVDFDLIIEPKMSFGTAHHETTSLMIEYLLQENTAGKSVLDMGSGTGVLAILAYLKGSRPVVAIDNDEWAYKNNIENNAHNHTEAIQVIHGDAHAIPNQAFDLISANINRNILLNDIVHYAKHLKKGGNLIMSGFYHHPDLEIIKEKCQEYSLTLASFKEKNDWVAGRFILF
ncbi:MAG: 50S ribosomal protein L11 methyltransferase [Bacteroidales bacterium]|nr:50S ribosomal protein L11 methyltransferase [Bacteroidales bacterium]